MTTRNWHKNDKLTRPDGKIWTFTGTNKGKLYFDTPLEDEICVSSVEAQIAWLEQQAMENTLQKSKCIGEADKEWQRLNTELIYWRGRL